MTSATYTFPTSIGSSACLRSDNSAPDRRTIYPMEWIRGTVNRSGMAVKVLLLSVCAMLAFSISLCALPVSAEDVLIEVGDYWEYEFDGTEEGFTMAGTYKLKVADTTETTVGGDSVDVFVIDITGSGDVTGSFEDISVAGNVEISGTMHRLTTNFSLAWDLIILSMDLSSSGLTFDMDVGTEATFTPVLDDFVGDEQLENGAVFESEILVESAFWTDFLGFNESESSFSEAQIRSEVVGMDVPVSTTAGDFTCSKIEVTVDVDNETMTTNYYYSEKVGNYVKIEGDGDALFGFSSIELKKYSYSGSGGAFALFEDPMMLILIAVIVAVVIIVVLALVLRKKGKAPAQMVPPPPGYVPPPPPPV